ncbi:MAG: acyl carrier protein [Bacteroidales bacterium]|jgi:acyl carrier protein|nr:acyl carrier protein [Bacteroidales bacterium]
MNRQELIEQVNTVLAETFEVAISKITPDAEIKETLDLDSLSLVDMVALIETTFGVAIKGQHISSIKTFDNLYDFISDRIKN